VVLQGAAGAFLGGGVCPGDHERLHLGVVHPGSSQVGQGVQIARAGPAQHQVRGLSRGSDSGQRDDTMAAIVPRPARTGISFMQGIHHQRRPVGRPGPA
jgi:hypothetical protein